jgi:glycosyltransferase involved in cell wall biosynthesis
VADARFVVTISQYNRALLQRIAGAATPIHVVHAGIDVAAYDFRPRRIPADGPVRALTVASLQEYKGHAVLLAALAQGGPGVDRISLDLIGDGVLRADLEKLSAALGLEHRVRFLGIRSQDEVRAALDAADIFVLPSIVAADGQMEGLPVALMEALACGVPTVSTALSGIPEIIVDNVTGLLAVPGDPVSLNTALTAMTDADTERFGLAGRELVTREFDLTHTIGSIAELLRQTCR